MSAFSLTSSWTGLLGSTASYLSSYVFLLTTTMHNLGRDLILPSESSSGWTAQQTIWHNLLAIWLWRYLITAVEGLSIPGLISVRGWILHHLPSYYLWITAFFIGMLVTPKTAHGGVSPAEGRRAGRLRERKLTRRKPTRGTPTGLQGDSGRKAAAAVEAGVQAEAAVEARARALRRGVETRPRRRSSFALTSLRCDGGCHTPREAIHYKS